MSQFFEAQERYRTGKLLAEPHAYVRDLLRSYGDKGQKMSLPDRSSSDYERALQYRVKELQDRNQLRAELSRTKSVLHHMQVKYTHMQQFLNSLDILDDQEEDAPDRARDSGGHDGRHSGRGVLPPASDSGQDDTKSGQPETIISSTVLETDEPSDARSARSRRHNAKQRQDPGQEGGEVSSQRADPRGPLPDAPDRSEPDVGGSADQHSAEE